MASLIRRRLTCFYCGTPSDRRATRQLREWKCDSCEAVNYLDENGQITDPPPQSTPGSAKYARPSPRPMSPDLEPMRNSPFCTTCQKNQHLYHQALSSYLPDVDGPDAREYEDAFETYKAGLEKRYPQICADCAPRVNDRLRATVYAAKTDHLRRMMDKTKRGGLAGNKGTFRWKDVGLSLGGLGWSLSVLVQLVYNALGMLTPELELVEDSGRKWRGVSHVASCTVHSFQAGVVRESCFDAVRSFAVLAVALSSVTCWWNPQLRKRLHQGGQLHGQLEHMLMQWVVLVTRIGAGWGESRADKLPFDYRAVHAFMFIFMILTSIRSLWIVKHSTTPRISFAGLKPVVPPEGAVTAPKKGADFFRSSTSSTSFPISALARRAPSPPSDDDAIHNPRSYGMDLVPYNPEENDPNQMEWTPTRPQTFNPRPIQRPPQPASPTGPSPFRGILPAAPVPPAHKPYKPAVQFTRASEASKEKFNAAMAFGGKSSPLQLGRERSSFALAESRLQLPGEGGETGLEEMFGNVVSIRDEPPEVRARREAARAPGSWVPAVGAVGAGIAGAAYWLANV
ncbi:hypothetical protein EJ06DRAFT_69232 [Trichodelitschia bisporula]|uniref:Ima1 N-terminal domain-containing protein n=1 Tax=Trichodelitschia bisporula TaxID=703511 RepID=A0A6G1HT32_9PEZI|nr:hypothetical protein EJ06DRAFT_69232 [Trichodelitschia bisporula]